MRAKAIPIVVLIVGAACAGLPVGTSTPSAILELATSFPTSGPDGAIGRALQHAAQLAVDQNPSVGGFRLRLVPFDEGTPAPALSGLRAEQIGRELVADPRILGLVGPYTSVSAMALLPVTNSAGLAIVNPTNTFDCLTLVLAGCTVTPAGLRPSGRNDYFRLAGLDSEQGTAMANFAIDSLHDGSVAVFSNGSDYGRGEAAAFAAAFRGRSGRVLLSHDFPISTNDFVPWLSTARDAGAQAIYAGGGDSSSCVARRQAKEVFVGDVDWFVPDGAVTQICLQLADGNLSGHIYGTVSEGAPAPGSANAQDVIKRLRQEFPGDKEPQPYALATYDAARILIDAIRRAIKAASGKTPTRQQVTQAVAATHDFAGVTGTYSFTPGGDAIGASVSIYQVRDKQWGFLRRITLGAPTAG